MRDYAKPIVVKSDKTTKGCYIFAAFIYTAFSISLAYAILGGF